MKAVNLLPGEYRRAEPGTLRDASPTTLAVLGAMFVVLVIVAGYVVFSNDVASRKDQLARVSARAALVQRQADALKPYAQLASVQDQALSRVRELADGRFDWSIVLARLASALPTDVTLTALNGQMGTSGSSTPGSTAAGGPTVQLTGCTSSHSELAHTMDLLRGVDGVSDVQLQSSTQAVTAGPGAPASSGGCPRADQFALTVLLAAPAAPVATATSAGTPAPAAGTPATAGGS